MKERPILFSGPMVRAILNGWKTVTRRPVRGGHAQEADAWHFDAAKGLCESGIEAYVATIDKALDDLAREYQQRRAELVEMKRRAEG